MQLLTTTALLMNNHEVSYELFFNPKAYRYLFCPTAFTDSWYLLPTFWLIKQGKEWIMRGVESEEIKVQAIKRVISFVSKKSIVISNKPVAR